MKLYTVKEVAKLSGVTVRTLHHYDKVGLLKPAQVGENGYRYYGREELLRLQQILFHRELGVPLDAISELLVLDGENQIGVLRQHRAKLEAERERRGVAAAERAWAKSRELMADPSFGLVILDELNIALRYEYLDLAAVVAALSTRRDGLHVVVTGRNAKPELIAAADLVTEMTLVKHHFAAGVKAQPGIEF